MTDLKHWQKIGPGHDIMIGGLGKIGTIIAAALVLPHILNTTAPPDHMI
jgi:hypothetical protein